MEKICGDAALVSCKKKKEKNGKPTEKTTQYLASFAVNSINSRQRVPNQDAAKTQSQAQIKPESTGWKIGCLTFLRQGCAAGPKALDTSR